MAIEMGELGGAVLPQEADCVRPAETAVPHLFDVRFAQVLERLPLLRGRRLEVRELGARYRDHRNDVHYIGAK